MEPRNTLVHQNHAAVTTLGHFERTIEFIINFRFVVGNALENVPVVAILTPPSQTPAVTLVGFHYTILFC
jgi:hypothetical protein